MDIDFSLLSFYNRNYVGTCTMCGEKNCNLTIVTEEDHVCEECLDGEYIFCDECKEWYRWEYVVFYHLKDGCTLCEHCAEDTDPDEIDSVTDLT